MSLRIRLTPLQLAALRAVWPRLLQQPAPNCGQLNHTASQAGFPTLAHELIGLLNRLEAKNVLRSWIAGRPLCGGRQRLWAPGPMSDHLQEEGLLP